MATSEDYALLRLDMVEDENTLSDLQAEADYAQAAMLYPQGNATVIYYAARVVVARRQYAIATNQADYTQNQESESLGQIAASKYKLLLYWERLLDQAIKEQMGSTMNVHPSGTMRLRPVW